MYILLFWLLICTTYVQGGIKIQELGVEKMIRGDVGMVLYIKLQNTCKKKYSVSVKMLNCTEVFTVDEEESEAMTLLGGYMGILPARSEKILTLIYPNMYLYNRKAVCSVGIYYTDRHNIQYEIVTDIKICTTPRHRKAAPVVKDFYQKRSDVKACETVDLDPLYNCLPVDCMMKYLGYRNYFNDKFKRCQKVPFCVQDKDMNHPDVAYIPTSNRCRNLLNCVSEADIALLEEGSIINDTSLEAVNRGLIFRCNHGKLDKKMGICVCDHGWTSAEPTIEKYLPGLSVYHMCNIEVDSWNASNRARIRSTVIAFALLAILTTMIVLFLTFGLYGLYICCKNYEASSPFASASEDAFELESRSDRFSPRSRSSDTQ